MGREIREIPEGWQHPKRVDGSYQPLFDTPYAKAVREWKAGYAKWEGGDRDSWFEASEFPDGIEFWEWEGDPPNREYYRPEWPAGAQMLLCVYETVSEGTPVSPAFQTAEELVDYLVGHGDFWDQKRRRMAGFPPTEYGNWTREDAEAFVERRVSPTFIARIIPADSRLTQKPTHEDDL